MPGGLITTTGMCNFGGFSETVWLHTVTVNTTCVLEGYGSYVLPLVAIYKAMRGYSIYTGVMEEPTGKMCLDGAIDPTVV